MNAIYSIANAIATPMRTLFFWFSRSLPGVRAISRWSLPTKWSWLSLLVLLIIWAAAFVRHISDSNEADRNWTIWFLVPIPFVVVIPVLTYYLVKYLLLQEASRFPEIDRIWYDGTAEAESKGILINKTPIFLVLGTSQQREVKTLLQLTGLEFAAATSGAGSPPLSIHACRDAIFVFLNGCNCISRLSNSTSTASKHIPMADDQGMLPTEVGGTIDASRLDAMRISTSDKNEQPNNTAANNPFVPGGTMLLDESQDLSEIWNAVSTSKALNSNDIFDCEEKLQHVCKLINRARRPLCPINGIVSVLPFELVESSSGQLQIAIQKDLAILRQELQIRCPNTALVSGMESDEGFVELVKRLPAQQSSENRFGKGSDLWVVPDSQRLDAIAIHATATFEDWIYMLFQEANSLKKKNNSKLFLLLCRVRGAFAENLRGVLSRGFGFDTALAPALAYEQFLFGGCYFAATGNSPSQQAFVKSVFAKALEQEGELEWAPLARQQDQLYRFFANMAALIGTIALLAIAAMLFHRFGLAYVTGATAP